MNQQPIGVFDSGLGGLTVVKELMKILPHENIVYFGDTGRVPYGTRGKETIIDYAKQDIQILQHHQVKMIIAACGTVSAVLPKEYSSHLQQPYTGVVIPSAQAACAKTKTGHIGVLGTSATIRSGAYGKASRTILPKAVVTGIACPLFVPLVENGYINRDNQVTRMVAEDYLKPIIGTDLDTLILGCTHFPIIKEIIGDILGKGVKLIDSGYETARTAAAMLSRENMLLNSEQPGNRSFYVSDSIETFTENATIFLNEEITGSVEHHVW